MGRSIAEALVSVTFWAGMGWAIQDAFDKLNDQINAPRVEFVNLDWLDYCEDRICEKCQLKPRDLPAWARFCHFAGALLLVFVAQVFFWRASVCFGTFRVTDDLEDLRWWPWTEGSKAPMINRFGLGGLLLVLLSFVMLCFSRAWRSRHNAQARAQVMKDLQNEETGWKQRRKEEAENWAPPGSTAGSPVVAGAIAKRLPDSDDSVANVVSIAAAGAEADPKFALVDMMDSLEMETQVPDDESSSLPQRPVTGPGATVIGRPPVSNEDSPSERSPPRTSIRL